MNILSLFKYSYLLDIFKSEMLKLKLLFIETGLLKENMFKPIRFFFCFV